MKANFYAIIMEAVERGLEIGWNRALKHTDVPDYQTIIDKQADAIIELLDEKIIWDELNLASVE